MMISTSIPKSSGRPSTSITLPTGVLSVLGEFENLDVHNHPVQVFD